MPVLAALSSASNSSTPSTRRIPPAFCLSLPPATSTTELLNRTTIWFRTFRQTSTPQISFQSRPRIRLMHSQAFPISVRQLSISPRRVTPFWARLQTTLTRLLAARRWLRRKCRERQRYCGLRTQTWRFSRLRMFWWRMETSLQDSQTRS